MNKSKQRHKHANLIIFKHFTQKLNPQTTKIAICGFVDYDLKLSNFYTDYCKLLKFIEYWE